MGVGATTAAALPATRPWRAAQAWLVLWVCPVICAVVAGWSSAAWALDVPTLSGRVNDLAHVLSPGDAQALEQKLAAYEQQSGRQFALLTIPSLEGDAIESFALRVVEKWQLGRKQEDDGLLMLVAVQDRRMRIEVGYGLEGDIPDALAGRIIRNIMTPRFREKDYAGGINAAFDALIQAAAGQRVDIPERRPEQPGWLSILGPLFWLGLFLLIGLTRGGRGLLLGMIAGQMLGGGRRGGGGFGGRGGGGFGGGGFGGGGGGFGGGGASGGW